MLGRSTMRIIFAINLACSALLMGCTSSHSKADSHESYDSYRPEWLPRGAKLVFSYRWEDGFLGDATTQVKARVTEEQFRAIVQQLELTPHIPDRKYADGPPQWSGQKDKRWDPPDSMSGAFVRQQGRSFRIAQYARGFLYYESVTY